MAARLSKKRKLSHSNLQDADSTSRVPFQQSDFICPVCFDTLKEVYVTICGHSFCYSCIIESLRHAHMCPVCKTSLPAENPIHPNVAMNDLVAKFNNQSGTVTQGSEGFNVLAVDGLTDSQMEALTKSLEEKRAKRVEDAQNTRDGLMTAFLEETAEHKSRECRKSQQELELARNDLSTVMAQAKDPVRPNERQRGAMMSCFTELMDSYYESKTVEGDDLGDFSHDLHQLTRFNSLKELASLRYSDGNPCAIVSSMEFDKDSEFFAVAGVTKKIKVFSLRSVMANTGFQNHYPVKEMLSPAKLSSVHFNPYLKTILLSSDYAGAVCVWDSHHGIKISTHNEHGKRVWSAMFNPTEPQLFASGSDDGTVKLWCNNRQHSVTTLDTKANVCCVRFHPSNCYHLAYGSADHSVHLVDLRKPGQELHEFKGHKKAVSYVQFLSDSLIVSASTDSELKLWNSDTGQFVRTYKGHVNEKNFVGLSVTKDFISCGSENNCLYVYGRHVTKPMLQFQFQSQSNNSLPDANGEAADEFVSSVCWKQDSSILLGANSQGIIKVLELTE